MIYLDNAATSFPKPEVVYQALDLAHDVVELLPDTVLDRRARVLVVLLRDPGVKAAFESLLDLLPGFA